MARQEEKPAEGSTVGRLAERGEEAMNRLMGELGRNSKVTEALTRALAAKGMVDSASRTALMQVGIAPADEVRELRQRIQELEQRLGKLERASTAAKPEAKTGRTARTTKTTAKPAASPGGGPKTSAAKSPTRTRSSEAAT